VTRLRLVVLVGITVVALALGARAQAAPASQLTWAVHFVIAPIWFDPADSPGTITQVLPLYALHDALVKPMPGDGMAPSLAESWTASRDAMTYEFVLRKNVKFHNGDVVTAEDVKFSFDRYRGSAAKLLHDRVDDLFQRQARETDRNRREALLHQIQKIAHDRVMFVPIWEFAQLHGVGPRVEESGLGLIEYMPFSAPYEELRLRR